ncbi:MAG: type IX secretion system membrane protein PorP/SprF [Bacteroidota bacterium]
MKKLFAQFALTVAGFSGVLFAQQDPQFTQFMFNKLIYNPGYAGTSGGMCGVAQFRQQWVNFNGAPTTMAFSGDMKLTNLPVGVGINIINDKIGAMNTFFLRFAGSYNIKIGDGNLGLGLDIGLQQKQIDNNWIVPEPLKNDPNIPGTATSFTNPNFGKMSYDMGAGAFYQIPKKFYVGLSSTHLPSQTIESGNLGFKVMRHYYFMTGANLVATPWLSVCPNILFKSDARSSSLDANLNLMWFDMAWVGATYRVNDAASLLLGYQGKAMTNNSLVYKIGYSYDFPTSTIKKYTTGTHEIILGVCYTPKVKKITTYANDRFLD